MKVVVFRQENIQKVMEYLDGIAVKGIDNSTLLAGAAQILGKSGELREEVEETKEEIKVDSEKKSK